jgi:hypothetical protein
MNETIAIFHLGGGPIVFKFGRLNHVSIPVTLWIFPCIQRRLIGEAIDNVPHRGNITSRGDYRRSKIARKLPLRYHKTSKPIIVIPVDWLPFRDRGLCS